MICLFCLFWLVVVCPAGRRGYRVTGVCVLVPSRCIEAGGNWRTEQTGGRDDPLPAVRVLPANTSLTAATTNHHNTSRTRENRDSHPPPYTENIQTSSPTLGWFLEFPIYRKWKDMDVMLWDGVLGSGKSQSQYGELNGETQIQNTEGRVTDKSSSSSSEVRMTWSPEPSIKLFSRAEVV